MNSKNDITERDPFAGFFASVVLALLASNTVAGLVVALVFKHIPFLTPEMWKTHIAAGLFVGIVLTDPVGTLIQNRPWARALTKFGLGFCIGVLLQILIVMPLAGGGMSKFVFLILAVLLLPIMFCYESYKEYMRARGLILSEVVARHSLHVMSLPKRLLIVIIMAISFGLFWVYGTDIASSLAAMGLVLVATTLTVAFGNPVQEQEDPWIFLGDDPEEMSWEHLAMERFREISLSMLPGAVLLGGVTRMSVDVLLQVYPNIAGAISNPDAQLQTFGIVAVSGLGVILFGMMAVLGFGLGTLILIGRVGKWNRNYLRERCLRLVKVLFFRPIRAAS